MFCMSLHVFSFSEMFSASFLILLTYSQRHRCTRRQASAVKQDESFHRIRWTWIHHVSSARNDLTPPPISGALPVGKWKCKCHCYQAETHLLLENGENLHSRLARQRHAIHCTPPQIYWLHCVPKSLATALVTSARRALRSLMQLAVCSRTSLMGRLCSKVKPLNCSTR